LKGRGNGARSWLPCANNRERFRIKAREWQPTTPWHPDGLHPNLTGVVNYVINQLHIMSRIEAKTDAFRAIADPTRRAILDRLRAGPANAGTLAADFRTSRPAVSRHLRVLREARLVVDTRIGRERLYVVNPVPLQSVAGWLEGYRAFWQASLTKLKRNLEAK
jgi:DNA-binding transcriptional ArsR family regulator